MANRLFADISDYQERFDALAYVRGGHRLVMIKATEGVDWASINHGPRADAAHGAGLHVWHYHFAHPDSDPDAIGEAAHFWRQTRPHYHPDARPRLHSELPHPHPPPHLLKHTPP